MPTVEILSRTEIERRREELLRSLEMTESELRERAASYALSAHESGVLAEIDGLDFLLDD